MDNDLLAAPPGPPQATRFRRVVRRIRWYWWVLLALFLVAAWPLWYYFFGIDAKIREYERTSRAEIDKIIARRYGDIGKLRNGWAFLTNLPDMQAGLENINLDVESSDCFYNLSPADQRKILETNGLFEQCRKLEAIREFDAFIPMWYASPQKITRISPDVRWTLPYVTFKNSARVLMLCAGVCIREGRVEEGMRFLDLVLRFIRMGPEDGLNNILIKGDAASIVVRELGHLFKELGLPQLAIIRQGLEESCLIDPRAYYECYWFESYSLVGYYLSGAKQMAPPNVYGYKPGVMRKKILPNRVWALRRLEILADARAIVQADWLTGDPAAYSNALEKWRQSAAHSPFAEDYGRLFFWNIKSQVNFHEHDAVMLMALTTIKATLYKHAHAVYPVSFHEMFKDGEYPYLSIDADGRRMTNRGCEMGFVGAMADGSLYSADSNRVGHMAFYSTPKEYGLTGESIFIVNETGQIWTLDLGESKQITRWPENLQEMWSLFD